MRDAGNDYRDDVGDDVKWLSYGELGQARGISTASAIRLVFRRKWRRQDGNDGTVRVAVPIDEANPQTEVADSDGDGIGREIGHVVGLLETATAMLRERGEEADEMFAALHATGEEALARAKAETATEREAKRRAEAEVTTERAARARAEAETATEREARKQAEGAVADAEAQLSQAREDFERERREAEARRMTEQAAREKAEAEAAQLRQENQARRSLGLLARLLAALRGE
jgi:flagellar biosynthesis GTPase FlhF